MSDAPILITGAAGFAGGHLLQHLAARHSAENGGPGAIVAWARSDPPPAMAHLATWRRIDLLDRDQVRQGVLADRPRAVFHCAGSPHVGESWRNATASLSGNVLAASHLFDALRMAGGRCRVLIPGSATIYAPSASPLREDDALAPNNPYTLSKFAQERLGVRAIVEDGLDVLLTRSFNHTGPRQTPAFAAPSMARQVALIERGAAPPVIKVGNLDARRDISDVRDVVHAYVRLMEVGLPGVAYNVASGTGHSIRSVLDGLMARARVNVRTEIDPDRMRPDDTPVIVGDATRLRTATGWSPSISFDRMLDDLLDYWRATVAAVS